MGEVKELTKTQRTIQLIIVIALLVYAIVNAFLVVHAYKKLDKNVNVLGDIITNWHSKTVTDIQVAATCPSGYETAFHDRSWPGINEGCYCGDVTSTTLQEKKIECLPFCSSQCDTEQLGVGCKTVPKQSAVPLYKLASQSGSPVQVCVKRSTDTWDKIKISNTCPAGQTRCGDSEDNYFCATSCPISSITIAATTGSCTGNCRKFSDTQDITWTTTTGVPLAEFTVNEYGMCHVRSTDNVTPGRSLFALLAEKPSTCNKENDARWDYEATVFENNLFQYNSISSIITSLSNYDVPSSMDGYYPQGKSGADYRWEIFSRNYVPWKLSCRERMSDFIDKKEFVDKSKTAQTVVMVIGLISTFFLGIVLSIMEIQNLRGVDLSCISGKGEEERTKLKRFKKWVNYGFKLIQLPFQLWAIVLATGSKDFLAAVAADKCSNDYYNGNIDYIANNLGETHRSNLTALALLVASLVVDLLLAAWEKRSSKKDAITPTPNQSPSPNQATYRPLQFDNSSSPGSPVRPITPQPQQPGVVINVQPAPMQFAPQQHPNAIQQPAPMQFQPQQPAPMQFQPQQYPPQQYPPQQYPPQQPAPMQFQPQQPAPMQFAPQQYPPQQQY